MDEYDYIVVGGGSAGAIVARRLSQNPSTRVALIEAGPSDEGNAEISHLDRWLNLLGGALDFNYSSIGTGNTPSFQHYRARVLGGCSSHNTAIMFRTPDYDLEQWVKRGASGWGPAECSAAMDRVAEKVPIDVGPREDLLSADFLAAAGQYGLDFRRFNTEGVYQGAGWLELAVQGRARQSSSVCYLHPLNELPENLSLHLETRAQRILFDGKAATGVETDKGDLRCTGEIILCAGVFDTPRLLMLSGVGPAKHLREIDVPVLVDLPGVGENLLDHPDVPINFETQIAKTASTHFYADACAFLEIDKHVPGVDVMFHFGNPAFDMQLDRLSQHDIAHTFNLSVEPSHARSEGRVKLRSKDPFAPLDIHVDFFTDPDDHDIKLVVHGLKIAREIVRQPALAKWGITETVPSPSVINDVDLATYARSRAGTAYHPCGTCRMGDGSVPGAVVDTSLKVHGLKGLRVADASIFPAIPSVNLVWTVMMVAERCYDLIVPDQLTQ